MNPSWKPGSLKSIPCQPDGYCGFVCARAFPHTYLTLSRAGDGGSTRAPRALALADRQTISNLSLSSLSLISLIWRTSSNNNHRSFTHCWSGGVCRHIYGLSGGSVRSTCCLAAYCCWKRGRSLVNDGVCVDVSMKTVSFSLTSIAIHFSHYYCACLPACYC